MNREQLIEMVTKLIDMEYSEEEAEQVINYLKCVTGDAEISDYLYWSATPMLPEDIVDKALGLRDVPWHRLPPP